MKSRSVCFLAILFSLPSWTVFACQCEGGQVYEVEEAFTRSSMALYGRVIQMKEEVVTDQDYIGVTFDVEKAFKGGQAYLGKLDRDIEILMPAASEKCRVEAFRVRDRFTVFAIEREGLTKLYTDLCWGNGGVKSDGTSKDLEWLELNVPTDPRPVASTDETIGASSGP